MVTQQHRARWHPMSARDLEHLLVLQQRTARAPQRTIGRDVDAFALAEIDNVLLRQVRVVFDLVDGGHDADVREEFLQESHAVVRHPDRSHFARVQEPLQVLVGLDVSPRVVEVAGAVRVFWEFRVVA